MNKNLQKTIGLSLISAVCACNLYADDVQLNDVYIKGSKKAHRKTNEITGLGKVVKTSENMNKDMVLEIRDLTRYDPGISVVEQGQGATSGYSIRGLDKNRIGMNVDGIAQVQYYTTQKNSTTSGAINEIEYENIKSIEISKGASSSEFGSGSLGGSIQMRTKDASDVIKSGKNWGLDTKTAYSGKNKKLTNSIALAGRHKGVEVLGIYTKRDGKETSIHDDAMNQQVTVEHFPYYKHAYHDLLPGEKLVGGKRSDVISESFYKIGDGEVKRMVDFRKGVYNEKVPGKKETLSGKDYTGSDRFAPNKMDYKSDSGLVKLGYNISSKQYIGGVYESTHQEYNIRDMQQPAYWDVKDKDYIKMIRSKNPEKNPVNGVYASNDPLDGLVIANQTLTGGGSYTVNDKNALPDPNNPDFIYKNKRFYYFYPERFTKDGKRISRWKLDKDGNPYIYKNAVIPKENLLMGIGGIGTKYTRTRFIDEYHDKERKGFVYKYQNDKYIDNLNLTYDKQDITLTTKVLDLNCETYPNVNKNCRASIDKPWSYSETETLKYNEKHDLLKLDLEKELKIKEVKNNITVKTGYDKFSSNVKRQDWFKQNSIVFYEQLDGSKKGTIDDPIEFKIDDFRTGVYSENWCQSTDANIGRTCLPLNITGKNYYLALNDKINVNKYLKLGLGMRYDYSKFNANDKSVVTGTYKNTSWNVGAVVKPTNNTAISYRISTGFRNPSFKELFGIRENANYFLTEKQRKALYEGRELKPEKALNQEISLGVNGDFGVFEFSYFKNRYKDLITTAQIKGADLLTADGMIQYRNLQDIDLEGINIIGKLDYNGIYEEFPEGLNSTFAYNKIKATKVDTKPGYAFYNTALLDGIQPARYVIGLGYDDPDERWGINTLLTHSAAKSMNETVFEEKQNTKTRKKEIVTRRSRPWTTVDLTGYYKYKNFVARAGVYNLFDKKYSTWESIRQTALTSAHQQKGSFNRYVASGRNYTFSLEMKF